ncbi:MAG: PAS domain-containing protein, partial [Pseudomonadota bacterium]
MVGNSTIKEFSAFLSQLAERSEHVYWLSSPDLESIQYISPAYEKIWGRKLEELYNDPEKWITFLHPEDAEHHHPIHVMKDRIKQLGQAAKYNEDYRIIRPDGEVRWIMDRGFPIYDPQGNCLGITGVALDVTKEKEAELKLAKAKIQAEAANRAKTEFLANMSHDVKTPLSGVIGMADLIAHDSTGKEKQRGEAIHSCGLQLLSFFNDCLELSKLEMLEWAGMEENFSLTTLLEQIHDLLAPTA